MNTNTQSDLRKADVDQLNSFLRGELAAVETYDQALANIDDSRVIQSLRDVRSSHDDRAALLRQKVVSLGGDPSDSSGIWGSFAKLMEGSAALFGVSPAIAALEEGEDRGRDDYKKDVHDMSSETRSFLATAIIPEQQRSHDVMSALQRSLRARRAN